MNLAFIHEWLTAIAGGEKVLEALYEMFPSPIFTLVKDSKQLQNSSLKDATIFTSFIQKLPLATQKYRWYLPFFPYAMEQMDVSNYEVVLSISHCVAKGVLTHAEQLHLCYCFTPMRYAWDLYHSYLQQTHLHRGLKGLITKKVLHRLRLWDVISSQRVDAFIANSYYIARRIQKTYGRSSFVIYPPVDTDYFSFSPQKENYYITASRMVPYKRVDLIVEAFSHMPQRKLIVIGEGPERGKIQAKAKANIQFLGAVPNLVLKQYLQKARAFLFAAVEDFGIAPIEAMSTGTPVIAYGRGGVLETVLEGKTGVFFQKQTPLDLIQAVENFEKLSLDYRAIHEHAKPFNKHRFQREFKQLIETQASNFFTKKNSPKSFRKLESEIDTKGLFPS